MHKPQLEGLPGGCPGSCPLSRSSPPDRKNSRGASRLRQIEPGYNLLLQVRRDVTERRRPRTASPVRWDDSNTSLGSALSPPNLPWR